MGHPDCDWPLRERDRFPVKTCSQSDQGEDLNQSTVLLFRPKKCSFFGNIDGKPYQMSNAKLKAHSSCTCIKATVPYFFIQDVLSQMSKAHFS